MGVDELGFTLALLTVGMSMVAARSRQMVASMGASALWASLLAYILANTTAGLNWQAIFIISAFAFIVAMLMFGVFRRGSVGGIRWQGIEGGEETESKPVSKQVTDTSVRQSRSSRHGWGGEFAESPEEYQARVHKILHPSRRRR